jgi:hypothetical protein
MTSTLFSRPTFHPPRLPSDLSRGFVPVTMRSRPMFVAVRKKSTPPPSAAVTAVRNYLSSPTVSS